MTMPPGSKLSAADDTLSPVDLPMSHRQGKGGLRWASVTIVTAAVVLALTNATTIRGWAVELEPGPAQARLVDAAERWEAITDGLGLGDARATMHGWWKRAQAARFGDEAPARE